MPAIEPRRWWRFCRGLLVPVLLWGLVIFTLREPVQFWLHGVETYDQAILQEWVEEARLRYTLREMIDAYLAEVRRRDELARRPIPTTSEGREELAQQAFQQDLQLALRREEIRHFLEALGNPLTKMYPGQLPLFPIIYRMEVRFKGQQAADSIVWDSGLPHDPRQYRQLPVDLGEADVHLRYQLHAYNRQQQFEQDAAQRRRWIIVLAMAGTALGILWMYWVQRREQERERQRALARHQLDQAERARLEEELRRQEAENRHEEVERKLLEQRLATQAAERQALELKSQLYASIGIMAGSYAHNIKNLLVRPNDLLRRCLEGDGLSNDKEQMIHEVRLTLGTVTERLQQILRTVRRDPSRSELTHLDLNDLLRELHHTWRDLAREKWKLDLHLELAPEPLLIEGDVSHLQQAVENLLFNARDATFEMRNHLRDQAHRAHDLGSQERRQALIAAASWRGAVSVRTWREGEGVVLEVRDNGIGMSEEVRQRCTETHFSTKRDNALYEGNSTGMGLGLSFVVVILDHHRAKLDIDSEPQRGTTFRVTFPAASAEARSPVQAGAEG